MQEFIKLTKHIKEVIEGLVEPTKDSTKHAPMNNSKSDTKIPVTTKFSLRHPHFEMSAKVTHELAEFIESEVDKNFP